MDKQKQEAAFSAQFNKLMLAMSGLGGHSRFLFMDANCAFKIAKVISEAEALKALADGDNTAQHITPIGQGVSIVVPQSPRVKTEQAPESEVKQEPGFSLPETELEFTLNDIALPLDKLFPDGIAVINNPFDQRIALRSSDETVIGIEDGIFMVKGEGQSTLSVTFYKDAGHAGSKSDMQITLTLAQSDDEDAELDNGESTFGFIRPEPDFDIDLELGKDAFIGTVIDLPVELQRGTDDVEFESSDESVFQVDAKTGAILPVGAGDAMLIAHCGDAKDELMVSIK